MGIYPTLALELKPTHSAILGISDYFIYYLSYSLLQCRIQPLVFQTEPHFIVESYIPTLFILVKTAFTLVRAPLSEAACKPAFTNISHYVFNNSATKDLGVLS